MRTVTVYKVHLGVEDPKDDQKGVHITFLTIILPRVHFTDSSLRRQFISPTFYFHVYRNLSELFNIISDIKKFVQLCGP